MKKIVFIIPYFGKFNNYFNFFLKSCEYNSTIDFLVFTDDKTKYIYPPNVKVIYMTFENLKQLIQNKFDFKISLENAYKLCDYKPAYGYIFEEYIKDYDFWGYCDTDLIFGNIREFYSENILNKYDKIGIYGHASILKNTPKINNLFMKKYNNQFVYKEVFKNKKNSSLNGEAFDEEFNKSINSILLNNNFKIFDKELQANIYMKSSNFKLTHYDLNTHAYKTEKNSKSIFVFDHGRLYRFNKKTEHIDDFLYIHMQSRRMKINTNNYDIYKIIPNSFDSVNVKELKKEKSKHFNFHYFRLRFKNLKVKIRRRLVHE